MGKFRSVHVSFVCAIAIVLAMLAINVPQVGAATTGSLYIYKKNSDGNRIKGACFQLYKNAGGGARGNWTAASCDLTNTDSDNDGKIVFTGLNAGSYVLQEYIAPSGYAFAVDRVVEITAGERTQVTIKDPKGGTTLIVTKTTSSGSSLKGSCFDIYINAGNGNFGNWVTGACDSNDGSNDGKVTLSGLRIGNYLLYESGVPTGYKQAATKGFTVGSSSGTIRVTVIDEAHVASKTVTVSLVDSNGNPIPGSCFSLRLPVSNPYAPGGVDLGNYTNLGACDANDGANDGKVKIFGVEPGSYLAVQTNVVDDYVIAPIKYFSKSEGTPLTITIVNKSGGGSISIASKDSANKTVRGLCYTAYRVVDGHRGVFINGGCDFDGTGVTIIASLPNGKFTLRLTGWVPSAGGSSEYSLVSAPDLTLASNADKSVTAKVSKTGQASVSETATTATASPTITPTATATATATPSEMQTPEATPTSEPSPSPTVTATDVSTPDATPSAEASVTPVVETTPEPTEPNTAPDEPTPPDGDATPGSS